MKHTLVPIQILAASSVLLGACAAPELDVMPRYGLREIEGDLGMSSSSVTATADVEEAGLDDDTSVSGRIDFKWGLPHLVVLAQQDSFDGSGTVDAELSQGGVTIPMMADVDSELDLGLYSAFLVFDLVPGDTFELGLGAGLTYIDFDTSVTDRGTTFTVESDESFVLPVLAGNASIRLGRFEGVLLLSGFHLAYDDQSATFLDGDLFGRMRLFGGDSHLRASLVAGWRATKVELDYEDGSDEVEADLDLAGPYVGLEVTL